MLIFVCVSTSGYGRPASIRPAACRRMRSRPARSQVNGERVKPAKVLKPGDALTIRNGPYSWEITVLALGERRGSAAEALKLYSESDESRKAREEKIALVKIERQSNPFPGGRPTKKQRRQIIRFTRDSD